MARTARKFLVRRSKDNLSVVFARRARRIGAHPLGNLQAVASTRTNRINILNTEETEIRGEDFFEIKNIRYSHWWTRNWRTNRTLINLDIGVGAHTSQADVITELNNILGYTTATEVGDEGGSGLSSVGGTSVTSFRLETVDYCLEDGTGRILSEDDDIFISEELNTVIQRSDGTFLSVDTRSVSHGASGGGGAGNPVTSGAVSGNTLTLTLDDASTVDINVAALVDANPVASGAVSGTDLVLTLDDASTVTIDATDLKNLDTSVSIASPNWYQQYASPGTGSATAGAQINTTLPPSSANPYYFGTTLKRGHEFLFDVSFNGETIDFGIWGGSTTYTPNSAGLSSLWTKKLRYGSSNDEIKHGSGNSDTVGFDLSDDYGLTHGTTKLALQYDYDTNKLKLYEVTDGRSQGNLLGKLITTASVAEDGNPVTISWSNPNGGGVPNFVDRQQTWDIIAQVTAGADTNWRDGLPSDTVIRRNVGLYPGQKMTCTTLAAWQNQFIGFDYTGTTTGQTGVETACVASLKFASNEKIAEHRGYSVNALATRYESAGLIEAMGGGKVSFRYHTDNSFDLYDEDNEDVLFTKDDDMDGSVVYMHHLLSATITASFHNTTWLDDQAFDNVWYKHGITAAGTGWYQGWWYTGASFGGGANFQKWGQYLYPGQELVWTHYQPTNNTTYLGIRNTGNTGWIRNLAFKQTDVTNGTGFDLVTPYEESDNILLETDVGLGADELLLETGYKLVQEAATLGTKWSLRYDKGDNKLKLYSIATTTGIETLVTTANSAQDGSAITIHGAGAGHAWIFDRRYYGWEYIHEYVVLPWQNWRIDRPSANNELANDAVLRSLRGLNPGYYMRWTTGVSAQGGFFGKWKAANAATGLTGIENTSTNWEFGFKQNNLERYESLVGMTFNTSNSNYNAGSGDPYWQDPVPGTTQVQWRYHSVTNKLDLHDHTNNQVIATKTDDPDGTGIFLDYGNGVGLSLLTDDFLGGGDVTIAESTFAPTFTDAINYGNDGILHQGEMISIDTTVPAGKRLILTPDFWGLQGDQSGIAGSGPGGASGWQEGDIVHFGWQKANSPFVGTNMGSANSGWDSGVRLEMRGAGAGHSSRIRLYSDGEATFTMQDSRNMTNNYTDLYFTFDRISSSSGRIMAFTTLAAARIGVTGDNTQFYGTDSNYMNGTASTLALTGDLNVYVYSNTGSLTLPIVPCTELVRIPT